MDARDFYAQIDKTHKEFIDIKREFFVLWRRFKGFSCRLEELTSDATKIKDEEKSEKFIVVLSSLSERSYKCDKLWHDISAYLVNAQCYAFVELVAMAEKGLKGKALVPMAKEEEEKDFSEADNN